MFFLKRLIILTLSFQALASASTSKDVALAYMNSLDMQNKEEQQSMLKLLEEVLLLMRIILLLLTLKDSVQ